MVDYSGHRVERYLVEHLTKEDLSLGFLDGVSGGDLSFNANATLPSGGTVLLRDTDQEINFSRDRFRVWIEINGSDRWPLGVYVLAAPNTIYTEEGRTRQVTLIDKMTVIRDTLLTETLQVTAGTNIVDTVVQLIQYCGETRITATESNATLTNDISWDPGTSVARVINDLLIIANYWSLWTDRNGQFRIDPYVSPADRPVAWEFVEGDTSIHSPTWEHEFSLWEATNMVVLVSQEDDNENVWHATAVDDNPDSPTSTVSMGRVLNPIVEENVEASSQLDLQTQANRKLIDNSNVAGKLAVSHAQVPVWYNELVRFSDSGTDTLATITEMSIQLIPGSLVQASWRQA